MNIVLLLLAGAALYGATARALAAEWLSSADSSYGVVVFAVAAGVAWQRRCRFVQAISSGETAAPGCAAIVAGLMVYLAGTLGADVFLTRVSLVLVLSGSIWFLSGRRALRVMTAPLLFLLLAIPLPALIVNTITLPLQLLASRLAESAMGLAAVPVFRDGNLLMLPSTTLEVEEACSGLRSLVSLTALGAVLAWATDGSTFRRALLVAFAVPIAVIANGLRIAVTGVAAETFRQPVSGTLHELTGWITFVVALGALVGVRRILQAVTLKDTWPRAEEAAA